MILSFLPARVIRQPAKEKPVASENLRKNVKGGRMP
jgi:hypothetical protein